MGDTDQRAALMTAAHSYTYKLGPPSLAMMVFADWLDENGETDLALAYRWAGYRSRYPRVSPRLGWHTWGDERHVQRRLPNVLLHQDLPSVVYDAMAKLRRPDWGHNRHTFRSAAEAFAALAAVLTNLSAAGRLPVE